MYFTHSLAGAASTKLVLSDKEEIFSKIERDILWFVGITASVFPDFDLVLVHFFGFDRDIFHRTFSHSISFAICLAALLTLMPLFNQHYSKIKLFLVYFLIIFSHDFLDYLGFDTNPLGESWHFGRFRQHLSHLLQSPFSLLSIRAKKVSG